jgi:hypothetical protein
VTYGFRRNLLGLRIPALVLDAAVVAICGVSLWRQYPLNDEWALPPLVAGGVAALHALYFVAFVNYHSVFEAASIYARQLLLSCEALQTATAKLAKK